MKKRDTRNQTRYISLPHKTTILNHWATVDPCNFNYAIYFVTSVIQLTCPMCLLTSSVFASLIGLSNPANPILNPSNPSSDPLTVITGARAYALATLLFRSKTIIFAQISSSIDSHLLRTSWTCSWKEKKIPRLSIVYTRIKFSDFFANSQRKVAEVFTHVSR